MKMIKTYSTIKNILQNTASFAFAEHNELEDKMLPLQDTREKTPRFSPTEGCLD